VIGGLSILVRQALSLQDAGVEEIVLVGLPTATLRSDPRLRIRLLQPPAGAIQADQPAIVASAGCIWHPAVSRRFARMSMAPADVAALGERKGIGEVVYVCGRARVGEIVEAVFTGVTEAVSDAVPIVARPADFVIAPQKASERRTATSLLLGSLHKPTDGLASRHLHRRISLGLTRRLLPHRITPNEMTLVAALFGAAGVAVAYRGGYWPVLAGAVLFETQNILDGCDGEISRLKYLRSRTGEWLDQIVDDVLNIAFLSSIGLGLARGGEKYATWLTLVAIVSHVVHMTALYSGLILKAGGRGSVATLRWWVGGGPPLSESAEGQVTPAREQLLRTLGDITRRDLIALAYVVAAALNMVRWVFLWHVVVTFGSALVAAVQWILWGGPEFYSGDEAPADAASEVTA
jgi:phosphatidylglycerophosphate synthase